MPSSPNLVFAMGVLGVSGVAVWAGITDPDGGVFAGVRAVLAGQQPVKRTSIVGAAFVSQAAALAGGAAGAGRGSGLSSPVGPTPGAAATSGARATVVGFARSKLGVPYSWGGNGPSSYDCSGLTVAALAAAGVKLPRVAAQQQAAGVNVAAAKAQPGDLVFYGFPAYHVGIYVGAGYMIHAPRTGTVVRVEKVNSWATPTNYRNVIGG